MRYAVRQRPIGFSHGGAVPLGVKWLLITNTALFILYFLVMHTVVSHPSEDPFFYFGLVPRMVIQVLGIPQLFTYMFLHDPWGFWHILINMLMLWMFGADLERTWGTRRFLHYYLLCGIGAGVSVVIGNAMFGTLDTRTIGASGAVFGLLLAFGMQFPNVTVLFSFLFPIKAKYFVMILGAIAFLSTIGASGSGVSHVAHLGGMVFGYLYLRSGFSRIELIGPVRRQYADWKMRRARRKFKVYLRKKDSDSDRDRWVH